MFNYITLPVMAASAVCAATVCPEDCNCCIIDTTTREIHYVCWYAYQVDNSVCFIDTEGSRHWLPVNTFFICNLS